MCSWALSAVLSAVSALALVSVCAKAPGRSWALLCSWAARGVALLGAGR
ncbi:membrane protein [Mycobacterium phage MiniLon]|nr:membrane protein [Mycobacterium phage MiniLon]